MTPGSVTPLQSTGSLPSPVLPLLPLLPSDTSPLLLAAGPEELLDVGAPEDDELPASSVVVPVLLLGAAEDDEPPASSMPVPE